MEDKVWWEALDQSEYSEVFASPRCFISLFEMISPQYSAMNSPFSRSLVAAIHQPHNTQNHPRDLNLAESKVISILARATCCRKRDLIMA